MRWTVEPGIELQRIQTEHDAVTEGPGQPHKNVAGNNFADEEHSKAYDEKQNEHHWVEKAKCKRQYVLVEDGRDEKYSGGRQYPIAWHHDLVYILVNIRIEPVVHHHVPSAVVRRVGRTVPPVL